MERQMKNKIKYMLTVIALLMFGCETIPAVSAERTHSLQNIPELVEIPGLTTGHEFGYLEIFVHSCNYSTDFELNLQALQSAGYNLMNGDYWNISLPKREFTWFINRVKLNTNCNIQNMTVTYTFRTPSNSETNSVTILEHIAE